MTRAQYIATIERRRAKYISPARTEFKRALNACLAELMVKINAATTAGDMLRAADAPVDTVGMKIAIEKVYSKVGADFARATIKEVNTKKGISVDLDYWLEYFKKYAQAKAAQKIVWITGTTEEIFKRTVNRIVEAAGESGQSIANMARQIQSELSFSNRPLI